MKKITIKDIGYGLVVFAYLSLIALGMMSCGARKTDRQFTKEEVKIENTDNSVIEKQAESNVKENVVTKIDDKNKTITEETTWEPKDPTKEAVVIDPDGKKTVLNNSKKTTKKTTQINDTKSEINAESDTKQKEAVKEAKNKKQASSSNSVKTHAQTKRDAVSLWNWLWLLIPIAILIWLFNKYREKIWWF